VGNPPQPFSGTIEGIPISGVATTPLTTISTPGQAKSSTIKLFRWKGTLGGKPYDVGLYAEYHRSTGTSEPEGSFPGVTVSGTWGTEAVNGRIATPSAAEIKSGTGPVHFDGTIGGLKVSGTITRPTGNDTGQSGSATFTVSN
jgi:hypothetical protein